jgi:hypothetical protein
LKFIEARHQAGSLLAAQEPANAGRKPTFPKFKPKRPTVCCLA